MHGFNKVQSHNIQPALPQELSHQKIHMSETIQKGQKVWISFEYNVTATYTSINTEGFL